MAAQHVGLEAPAAALAPVKDVAPMTAEQAASRRAGTCAVEGRAPVNDVDMDEEMSGEEEEEEEEEEVLGCFTLKM